MVWTWPYAHHGLRTGTRLPLPWPFVLEFRACFLLPCSTFGNVELSLVFPAHSVSSCSTRLSSSEMLTGRREKNASTTRAYKTFRWGLSVAWANIFGYTLGICFHSTPNFIKIQIMKLDDVELGKQILYDFYFARNLVHNSENSQSGCVLFHLKIF